MQSRFIPPSVPKRAAAPPLGNDWLHEVKFDGFRVQVHIVGGRATMFSRNGNDLTKRFSALRPVLSEVADNNAIIDAELVSCGKDGQPDFVDLMKRAGKANLCLWAFDLCRSMALCCSISRCSVADTCSTMLSIVPITNAS